jgi:hypothetical protein
MKKSGITFGWRKQSFFNDCHQREDVVQYRNGPYKDGCIEHRERTYSWVPENFVLREDEGRVENDEDKAMREESMQQLKYTGGVFSDVAFDANGLKFLPPFLERIILMLILSQKLGIEKIFTTAEVLLVIKSIGEHSAWHNRAR